jgi:hypothetical protein
MTATHKIFCDGLIVKDRRESAPEWVKGSLSVKVDEFKAFLDKHNNGGWVNIDLLTGKSGKPYAVLNTWKPRKEEGDDDEAID